MGGQWPVSDDWSIFDITWLTPWATSSPTPWFRAAQCSGPHKLTEYNKGLWNISNISWLCRIRRREEVPGVRPPNSGSWHGCCIHCWPGPRRWVEPEGGWSGWLQESKMRHESLVLLLQTENSKFQQWGRGNLGNARKKTFFFKWGVPLACYLHKPGVHQWCLCCSKVSAKEYVMNIWPFEGSDWDLTQLSAQTRGRSKKSFLFQSVCNMWILGFLE